MRAMRACATANALFLGLALGAFAFAACSSGTTSSPPPESAQTPGEPAAAPSATGAEPGPAPSTPEAPAEPAGPPSSEITNEPPDGGTVMNNAMTAADAGASDRLQPLIDLIKSNRDGFRRCFDQHAKKYPGAQGRLVMVFSLKPDGTLREASIDAAKSAFQAPDVESCMIDFAKTLAYPKSPSGKDTKFTYPFDFKAKSH